MTEARLPLLDPLRAPLLDLPRHLAVFDRCAAVLAAGPESSFAVAGSVATGVVDEFSDLDLIVLLDDEADAAAQRARILEAIREAGEVLASFSATHLGMPDLFIEYLRVDDWLVKLDIAIQRRSEARPLPHEAVVVHDVPGRFEGVPRESAPQAVDFEVIDRKFCGWLWYIYTKIARGELFQAARSIDYSRENALLPGLLFLHDLPQDGHRRIEQRLPSEVVQRLVRSYPTSLASGELLRALRELSAHYLSMLPSLAHKLSADPRRADTEGMMDIIERHARGEGGEGTAPGSRSEEPWYVRYYGDDYTLSVRDLLTPERTAAEVAFLLEVTGIEPPAAVADVGCGDGRHARLLAERGFMVTGIDLNPEFIARGRRLATPGRAPKLLVGTMLHAVPGPYEAILSLFHSFGFLSDEDNEKTLVNWAAQLVPGGVFLIDLWNRDAMVRHFRPDRTRQISDELSVREAARFDPLSGRVARDYEYIYADGRVNRYQTTFRLYSASEMRTLFERVGLRVEKVFGSLTGDPYSWDTGRLVMLARKPT